MAEPPNEIRRQAINGALKATDHARESNQGAWIVDYMAIHDLQVQLGDVSGAEATRYTMSRSIKASEASTERDSDWKALALFFVRTGNDAEADEAIQQIGSQRAVDEALVELAAAFGARGDAVRALGALTRLTHGETRESAISLTAQWAANERHYALARQVWDQSADDGRKEAAALMIANAATRAGDFDVAQAAVSQILALEARINVLHALGSALVDAGRAAEALEYLREAAALVRASDNGLLREVSAKLVTEELAAARDFEAALRLAPLAGEDSGDSYVTIAVEQARASQVEAAQRTIALIPPDQSHLKDLARAAVIIERILLNLDLPAAASGIPDSVLRARSLRGGASEGCKAGNRERSREMLRLARIAADQSSREDRDVELLEVAHVQGECELGDDARDTARLIRSGSERADALSSAATAFARVGARSESLEMFREALNAGRGHMGIEDFAFIIEMMAESGLITEALAEARALPQRSFEQQWARESAVLSVVAALALSDRPMEALALVDEIPNRRALAYRYIAGERPH